MFTHAGHEVLVSFSRDRDALATLATELGDRARTGTAAEAVTFGPVVISCPTELDRPALAASCPTQNPSLGEGRR